MPVESEICACDMPLQLHLRASSKKTGHPPYFANPFPLANSYSHLPFCPTPQFTPSRLAYTDALDTTLNLQAKHQRPLQTMADDGGQHHQWVFYIILIALLLSLVVFGQVVTTHYHAFMSAPGEFETFIDALEYSAQENDSYGRDITKVQRADESKRLEQILRDIYKYTHDLQHQVKDLIEPGTDTLRYSARFLWPSRRLRLEERVRRLDLLRMRFLVMYMGIIASQTPAPFEKSTLVPTPRPIPAPPTPPTPPEGLAPTFPITPVPKPPPLPKSLTDAILKKPTLKKISTTPITKKENKEREQPSHMGWAGVIAELQKSPLLHKRHASIETAMTAEQEQKAAATPMNSPLGVSPL